MNNTKKVLLFIVVFMFIISCNNNEKETQKIDGLWGIKNVKMDGTEMTPVARWMRFNADSTQSSGNGWLQHSVGNWSFNKNSKKLSVTNTNGIIDNAEPFTVQFDNKSMIWSRVEEGHPIEVTLERIDKLPTSPANKLYGLWKFDSVLEEGKEVLDSLNPTKNAMLFLRWDNTYELRNYPKGEKYGMFKTHGHRTQIDMVSYSKEPKYQFYEFGLDDNVLTLKSTNSNKQIKLTRIHQFLQ